MSEYCPHCGANMKKSWHNITPILAHGLIKLRNTIVEKGENKVHLLHDMKYDNELKLHQWNNWTKLRFHGLVAKYKEGGKILSGYWLLTRRGAQFLNGELTIPKSVQTFRNVVVGHSEDLVSISDVMKDKIYVQTIHDIKTEEPTEEDIQLVIKRKNRKKKGKTYCPKCDEQMKVRIDDKMNENGSLSITRTFVCPGCQYEQPFTK